MSVSTAEVAAIAQKFIDLVRDLRARMTPDERVRLADLLRWLIEREGDE